MVFERFWRRRRQRKLIQAITQLRRARVGDILTRYLITVRPQETIIQAATKMIAEDVSCLIVKDGEKLCGILSERDFLTKVPLTKQVFAMQVKDIMTPAVVTVPPTMLLTEAVALMKKQQFRRLVVAENGQIMGLITQTDLARRVRDAFHHYPVSEKLDVALLTRPAVLTTPKESFKIARDKMKKNTLGGVIITDKLQRPHTLLGFFSEYDVVMQFYNQHGKLDVREVSSFTRKYVRGIPAQTNIFEANCLLLEKKVHRFPVVDEKGVVGLFTQTEFIRFVYCNLDLIEQEATKDQVVVLTADPKDFEGQFRGDRLKVYTAQSVRLAQQNKS